MKRAVFVTIAGLLFSFSYVVASASADTPGYLKMNYLEAASYEPFTEPPSPAPEQTDTCWDCPGSTMTEAEKLAAACTPAVLAANPQHLDLCFPEKWAWVCFPLPPDGSGTCEMYRRDLDPLGIFATPPPPPIPGVPPAPAPTATPEPTPELTPEPESTATDTP